MSSPRPRAVSLRLLVVHAAVVVLCTAVFWLLVVTTPPEDGFNFGVAYVGLPLLALGLPWSLPALVAPYQFDGLSPLPWSLVYFGPAFLNVALHGVRLWLARRRHRQGPGSIAGTA